MKFFTLLFSLVFLFSCTAEPKFVKLDLMSKGVPITIMAPDSAEVKTMDLVVQKDITIRKGDDYYVQIYASDASANDLAALKADKLAEVKGNRYFSKIIEEDEDGFVYETKVDSSNVNYGFRHVRIQGDKEYVFQTGLIGTFTLENAQDMYKAVQPLNK